MYCRSFFQQNINGSTYIPSSSFEPAQDLSRRDGDVHIVFLSGNGVRFEQPVNDLWYRVTSPTRPFSNPEDPGSPPYHPMYRPQEAASPMACLQQFQFCDGSKTRCGPLSSWVDARIGAEKLFGAIPGGKLPSADNHLASRFYWFVALMASTVPGLPDILQSGPSSLASTRSIYSGVMGSLPNNQWQVDVMQWWATYLAGIQAGVISAASGFMDSSLEHIRVKPYNTWIKNHVCHNQASSPFIGVILGFDRSHSAYELLTCHMTDHSQLRLCLL